MAKTTSVPNLKCLRQPAGYKIATPVMIKDFIFAIMTDSYQICLNLGTHIVPLLQKTLFLLTVPKILFSKRESVSGQRFRKSI